MGRFASHRAVGGAPWDKAEPCLAMATSHTSPSLFPGGSVLRQPRGGRPLPSQALAPSPGSAALASRSSLLLASNFYLPPLWCLGLLY